MRICRGSASGIRRCYVPGRTPPEQRCRDLDSRLRTVADERDRQRQRADEFEADLAGSGSRDGEVNALKGSSKVRDGTRSGEEMTTLCEARQLTKLETDRLEAKCKASGRRFSKKRADAAQIELERLATRPRPSLSRHANPQTRRRPRDK